MPNLERTMRMRYNVLTRNNDFVRAYTRGKAYVNSQAVLYVNKNRAGKTRVGIVSSKKIGNAVTRNRARRVLRAALWQIMPKEIGGYDIVVVARGQTAKCKSWQVAKALKKLFNNAGLLQDD